MKEIPFNISATKDGSKAIIRIVGVIGLETGAESFRKEVDLLVSGGVRNAHVYINSPGGSVFDANEIVNILSAFKGKVTGDGGAIVASAATFIAIHCATFTMPANGQFMIHKPSGLTSGRVSDIENYLKMMRDVEKMYYDAYMAKAKNKSDFKKKWDTGDYWLTAKEAKMAGFITDVNDSISIDQDSITMLAACGSPFGSTASVSESGKDTNLIQTLAVTLGLSANISENDLFKHIVALRNDHRTIKDDILKTAFADNLISDVEKEVFAKLSVTSINDLLKERSILIINDPKQKWTFKEWTQNEPKTLAEMKVSDNDRYQELFRAQYPDRN